MYRNRFELDVTPDPRAATLRWLTLFALLAYPVGTALEWGYSSLGLSNDLIGATLRFGSIIAALVILFSRLQQVAGGERKKLDEFELRYRRAALEKAYPILAFVMVASCLYLSIATDHGWWMPSSVSQWSIIGYYLALLAALLPTTVLVWSKTSASLEADNTEGE